MKKRLTLSSRYRIIAGVCGGIAEYLSIDPLFVRLVFIFLMSGSRGSGVWLYLLLWVLMPRQDAAAHSSAFRRPFKSSSSAQRQRVSLEKPMLEEEMPLEADPIILAESQPEENKNGFFSSILQGKSPFQIIGLLLIAVAVLYFLSQLMGMMWYRSQAFYGLLLVGGLLMLLQGKSK